MPLHNLVSVLIDSATLGEVLLVLTKLACIQIVMNHACMGQSCRVDRQMRHDTHVVELADFAVLLEILNLIVDFLLVCLGMGELSL